MALVKSSSLKLTDLFARVRSNSGLNQIRGTTVNGSTGAGIPKHVTNVSASMANASVGTTSTVTITFKRDPSDLAYSGVVIWVKGYQGNQSPTQVASSTDSPATVILNNTAEALSVIVQAYGNGGSAPLGTAPTTGVTLPKSTSGGVGTTTIVAPVTSLVMPSEFSVAQSGAAITVSKANEAANTVWAGPVSGANAQPTFRALQILDEYPFFGTYSVCVNTFPGPITDLSYVGLSTTDAFAVGTPTFGDVINPEFAIVTYPTTVSASTTVFGLILTKGGVSPNGGRPFTRLRQCFVRAALSGTTNLRAWIGWVGLSVSGATSANLFADVPTNPAIVGFRYSAGVDTNFQAVSKTNSTSAITVVNTGIAADANFHSFLVTSDGATMLYYIDGVLVATIATNLPTGGQATGGAMAVCDNKNTANNRNVNITHMVERYDWKWDQSVAQTSYEKKRSGSVRHI